MPRPPALRPCAALVLALASVSTPLFGSSAGPACPPAAELEPPQLLGLWRAEFDGQARGATLLLEPHREYRQSLSGEINRDGTRARVAADLEDGEFTMEESDDGRRISATWTGTVVDGSCGREIRGQWEATGGLQRGFTLRKLER